MKKGHAFNKINKRISGVTKRMGHLGASAFSVFLLIAGLSSAHAVTVEPDDYALGTNISSIVPGITLAVVDGSGTFLSDVFSVDPTVQAGPGIASTGSLTFGHAVGTLIHTFYYPSKILRADFGTAVFSVSIDVIANDTTDTGILQAFDASDTLIGSFTTAALNNDEYATAVFSSTAGNIAYIMAGGIDGGNTLLLDNLQVRVVPVPPALYLFGTGLLGLIGIARRKKAA